MHKISCLLLLLLISNFLFSQTHKKPLRRTESFFGLHFDFHASSADTRIGETVTEEMLDSMLTIVKPDFVQVDCKGHPGFSSYPTKVGTPAGGFVKDQLKIWRDVTSKHGVALYVHYSGVYDRQAVNTHPHWGSVLRDGKLDSNNTSVHSAYVDSLMIPQFKELITNYNINGIWVDGDCWALEPDYSASALQKFKQQTGINTIPRYPADANYPAFLNFTRNSFRQYVSRYVDKIHAFNPDFQVASNWAFSSFMPVPVDVNVDFLSGDLTPENSVNSAAFEARCLASQGKKYKKPWDLMSWNFSLNWDRMNVQTPKSVDQLSQEAAEVIAMGGGFQTYFTQNRDGSIRPWQVQTMKGLSSFMRPRQPFCQYATPVPQIALLYSNTSFYRSSPSVYRNDGLDGIKEILTALLDAQQAVEVLMEHHLKGNMKQYPLIVIPEWNYLDSTFHDELLQYVKDGGNLLVIGAKAVPLFSREAGFELNGEAIQANNWLGYKGQMAGLSGLEQQVTLSNAAEGRGRFYNVQDLRFPEGHAASVANFGKGRIASVFTNFSENYKDNKAFLYRTFLNDLVRELFPKPVAEVTGSPFIHVAVNKLRNRTIVHLINTSGPHGNKNVYSYDFIPPAGPLTVKLRMDKPKKLTLQPENKILNYKYIDGQAVIQLPKLQIHDMIVAE